jgi:preprotein translocase subunit SecE
MVERIGQFMKEVQIEMGKVAWPTRDELISSTGIVLVISFTLAVFVFFFDFLLSKGMSAFLK